VSSSRDGPDGSSVAAVRLRGSRPGCAREEAFLPLPARPRLSGPIVVHVVWSFPVRIVHSVIPPPRPPQAATMACTPPYPRQRTACSRLSCEAGLSRTSASRRLNVFGVGVCDRNKPRPLPARSTRTCCLLPGRPGSGSTNRSNARRRSGGGTGRRCAGDIRHWWQRKPTYQSALTVSSPQSARSSERCRGVPLDAGRHHLTNPGQVRPAKS
jgi:hypothetical protein